jgi:ParB-like chromosome segregation protein Spo0J
MTQMDENAPEIVSGELVPTTGSGTLAPNQLQAAVMDAAGMDRKSIARAVGVSESTIKGWRAKDEYAAEVERLRSAQLEEISEAVRALRTELTDGARAAIRTLIEHLDATNPRGAPLHGIQQKAAELLLSNGIDLMREEAKHRSAGDAPSPTTAIQINLGDGPPSATVD